MSKRETHAQCVRVDSPEGKDIQKKGYDTIYRVCDLHVVHNSNVNAMKVHSETFEFRP